MLQHESIGRNQVWTYKPAGVNRLEMLSHEPVASKQEVPTVVPILGRSSKRAAACSISYRRPRYMSWHASQEVLTRGTYVSFDFQDEP